MTEPRRPIGIVGAGSIGVSWAVVFARAGHPVALYDANEPRAHLALGEVRRCMDQIWGAGLLHEEPATVAARVMAHAELEAALAGATHIQECVPEDLGLKQRVLSRVEEVASPDAVLASSSSALQPSQLFAHLVTRGRCLVAHPANPPHILPVVELVGGACTEPVTVDRTDALLQAAGMSPVRVAREIEGFILNRLQGAVLREAYCLVRDGIADVEAVDRVVREGLGRRWSVVGPFETADLNTRGGIEAHARRLGPAYRRMGAERGQDDPWTDDLVAEVTRQRRSRLPLERWEERVAWRDAALLRTARIR